MEMSFFLVADAVAQGFFNIKYYPGNENLVYYQRKHHTGAHHKAVQPWYLHKPSSVRELPRASKPRTLKGCVETLPDGYLRSNPLPQVPARQRLPIGNILPPYLGISPLGIPNLPRIGQAIARIAGAQIIDSLLKLTTPLCYQLYHSTVVSFPTNNYYFIGGRASL